MSGAFVLLSEADQERLGCPPKLTYALVEITAREQATLQQAFGYHSPEDITDAMRAMVDEEHNKVVKDPNLFVALTWLGLRQAGVLSARRADGMAAELADLDIQIAWAQLGFEDAEGKDDSSTPTETSEP